MGRWIACVLVLLLGGCDDGGDAAPRADAAADGGAEDAAPGADADASDAGAPDAAPPLDRYEALRAPVEILFDDQNVPHLYAQDDLDLFFAAGYQQATDRLFALDMARRAALGTQSEVLGEGRLSADFQARALDFARLGRDAVGWLAEHRPRDHDLVVAFAGGLNRRVAEVLAGDAPRPARFEALGYDPAPFTPAELLAHGLRIQFGFSSTLDFDLLNTLVDALVADADALAVHTPATPAFIVGSVGAATKAARRAAPKQGRPDLDPAEVRRFLKALRRFTRDLGQGEGSNGWTVGAAASANGRPLFANDSHARYYDPNVMYVMHLNSADAGGAFDVVGLGFGGVPGVQVGQNRHIVWGATTAFADCTDLWTVQVRDGQVQYGDRMIPLDARDEVVRVRQPDGTVTEETVRVERVPGVGYLLPESILPVPGALLGRGRLLLGWPGFDRPIGDMAVYFDFGRATSVEDFRAAARRQMTGMQNWHVASAASMGHQTGSLVPDRGPAAGRPRASRILDGADPTTTWTGAFLDVDRLPAVFDDRPFISSANNDPFGHTADGDPLNDAFYFGAFFAPHFRAGTLQARLTELTARGGLTVDDMTALQMDVHSAVADRLLGRLDAAVEAIDPEDPALAVFVDRAGELRAARDTLLDWDRGMRRASAPAALFRIFLAYLARDVLADDMNLLFEAIEGEEPVYLTKFLVLAIEQGAAGLLDGDEAALLVGALDAARVEWAARGEPTWGDVLRGEWLAPDQTRTLMPLDGGDTTLAVAQCRFFDGDDLAEHCVAEAGSVWRLVTSFRADGLPVTVFTVPQTEAGSTDDWREGRYQPLRFERADIEANLSRRVTLR